MREGGSCQETTGQRMAADGGELTYLPARSQWPPSSSTGRFHAAFPLPFSSHSISTTSACPDARLPFPTGCTARPMQKVGMPSMQLDAQRDPSKRWGCLRTGRSMLFHAGTVHMCVTLGTMRMRCCKHICGQRMVVPCRYRAHIGDSGHHTHAMLQAHLWAGDGGRLCPITAVYAKRSQQISSAGGMG